MGCPFAENSWPEHQTEFSIADDIGTGSLNCAVYANTAIGQELRDRRMEGILVRARTPTERAGILLADAEACPHGNSG